MAGKKWKMVQPGPKPWISRRQQRRRTLEPGKKPRESKWAPAQQCPKSPGQFPLADCWYCGGEGHGGNECEAKARKAPSVATLASIETCENILTRKDWKDDPFYVELAKKNLKALRMAPGVYDRVKALREAFVGI